jgi:hypothetical protein
MVHKKADVIRLALEINVKITEDSEIQRIFADAPKGKVFSASFLHCMVADWDPDYGEYKRYAWADLGERLNYGIEDCGIEDCDTCAEERDAAG